MIERVEFEVNIIDNMLEIIPVDGVKNNSIYEISVKGLKPYIKEFCIHLPIHQDIFRFFHCLVKYSYYHSQNTNYSRHKCKHTFPTVLKIAPN